MTRANGIGRRAVRTGVMMFTLCAAAVPMLADACTIWRDPSGYYRGDCKLSDFKTKYLLNVELREAGTHYQLRFPNLHPRKFKYLVVGSNVDVSVDVQNLGTANAPAADLAVMLTLMDPLTGQQFGATSNYAVSVPALAAGTTQRVFVTTITMPTGTQDWDIVGMAVVDPPTPTQPVRGNVIESDEMDNAISHTCRVYGPNPDVTGPEACN